MNENSKQLLLDYFVGNVKETDHSNTPRITKIKEYDKNLEEEIKKYYPDLNRWNINFQLERNGFLIMFCSNFHMDGLTSVFDKSFIVVLNKKFDIVKYFDSYSSGTPFNLFTRTIDNDIGDGTIYAIDTVFDKNGNSNNLRILLLNDFTIEDNVQLLTSWNIDKYNNHIITPLSFYKKLDEGKYFFTWRCYSDDYLNIYTGALEFVNNVGSENEWNWYPYNGNLNNIDMLASQPTWIDNELNFKIFSSYEIPENSNHNTKNLCIMTRGDEGCVVQQILSLPNKCKNVGQILDAIMLGDNVLYETVTSHSWMQNTKYVIMLNLSDLSSNFYYEKEDYIFENFDDGYHSTDDDIFIFTKNGMFYFYRIYTDLKNIRDDNVWYTDYEIRDVYLNQIFDNNKVEHYIYDGKKLANSGVLNFDFSTVRIYDLYNFNIIYPTKIIKAIQIFNPNRYNGEAYISTQSLNAESTILYNDEDPVFARGLYNKSINDNVSVLTIEIPYNLLNDEIINNKSIISKTNTTIVDDNSSISKNIYETVYLNYVQSINIVDDNGSKSVVNRGGSSRLAHSISSGNDYMNQYISKARIVYSDNSVEIKNLNLSMIEKNDYEVGVAIKVLKNINYVELISDDEKTIYQTIRLDNLELNKMYLIKQRIRKG